MGRGQSTAGGFRPSEVDAGLSPIPLEAFAPELTLHWLARHPETPREPAAEPFQTVVLFSDISGFTALTEHLGERGARGAEEVKEILNACFAPLVDLIGRHGGTVDKFAGDAAVALWPVDRADDLEETVLRAAACCLDVLRELDGVEMVGGFELRLRLAVTVGPAWLAAVGGVQERWETVVVGEALDRMGAVVDRAVPGEAVLSREAWAAIENGADGTPRADGCVRLDALRGPPVPVDAFGDPPELSDEARRALRCFVPFTVQSRLDAGQTGWLAEFRRVTLCFVKLGGFRFDDRASLATLHRCVQAAQRSVYRFGGSVNQLMTDDKGICLIAAWGLAFRNYDDNAVRALRAAMELVETLDELGIEGAVGVASGRVYTGPRGDRRRMEYAVIGDAVNLAARLMQSARGTVLCDRYTHIPASEALRFEPLEPIRVKGKENPIQIFRPLGPVESRARHGRQVVGRPREQALLRERLRALLDGDGSTVVVLGDAGIGKTHLVDDFLADARASDARVVLGAGDAIERARTYYPMREVYEQLLGFAGVPSEGQRRRALFDLLPAEEHDLAPLLNPVLPFDLDDNEVTAKLTDKGRAERRRELLVSLTRRLAVDAPLVLVIEDAHWLDSASWALLEALHHGVDRMLLLVSTRPLRDQDLIDEGLRLIDHGQVTLLELGPLEPEAILDLVRRRLSVDALPEDLSELLLMKAEGHPFFTEELALSLRDQGLITIENGRCAVAENTGSFSSLSFPDTAQGVVTGRLDILNPQQQLTLKVASVMGRRFESETLFEIHPIAADRQALPRHLEALARLELLEPLGDEDHSAFMFKHSITQEAAYQLLPFAQRRELHRSVAEWHEAHREEDRESIYGLLAHHWAQAEVHHKALDYLEKAGEQAERSFAYKEAVRFFSRAVRLDERLADPAFRDVATGEGPRGRIEEAADLAGPEERAEDPVELPGRRLSAEQVRRARHRRKLGFAKANLDQLAEGAVDIGRSLEMLGESLPETRFQWTRRLTAQVLRQAVHRLRGSREYSGPSREVLLSISRAYARLGSYSYVSNRRLGFVYYMLSALNAAERAGPSPELATAYADFCVVAGLVPIHPLARSYARLALDTAERVDQMATSARVFSRTSIYLQVIGDWSARENLERSVEMAERLGDPYQWQESVSLLAMLERFQDRLERAGDLALGVVERSRSSGTRVHEMWGAGLKGEVELRLGRLDEAIRWAEEARDLAGDEAIYRDTRIRVHGILAVAHLRRGDTAAALREADAAVAELARSSRCGHLAMSGFTGPVEVYLHRLETEGVDRETHARAKQAWKQLRGFVSTLPLVEPRALAAEARLAALAGRPKRGARLLERALRVAEAYGTAHEQARIHLELGRLETVGIEDRRGHLARALEPFERIGARRHEEQCRELLEHLA